MAGIRAACFFLLFVLASAVIRAQRLNLCARKVLQDGCQALKKGDSPIACIELLDSADCAIKLAQGKADFGVFTANEILLTHNFYPTGLQVVAQLKHKDRMMSEFKFQSVVVVPENYVTSENGFGGLFQAGFCHPGFSKSQSWNDHILKYFEQKVMNVNCKGEISIAENEIANLRDFFKKSCRPGEWVADPEFDRQLKAKYPELCELCDNKETCSYEAKDDTHGHKAALNCLISGRGRVAYVAYEYAKEYFETHQKYFQKYKFLCPNGSVEAIGSSTPCTWYKEPWNAILAREDKASEVIKRINEAKSTLERGGTWQFTLNQLLFKDETPLTFDNNTSLMHYLKTNRAIEDVEIPKSECKNEIRWCTTSTLETNKCNWTSATALSLGIKPAISCIEAQNHFECFDKINKNEADLIAIDSNYGYLARSVYGLSPVMFCETPERNGSFVVGVIRNGYKGISKLENIKNEKVCFPEYSGIAWLSFLKVMRDNRLLSNSCKYPQVVSNFIGGACVPGFIEASHSLNKIKPRLTSDNLNKLCELCPTQEVGEKCEANTNNKFFGDKGALKCLQEQAGNIAFLESRNLQDAAINQSNYRVLCKNGAVSGTTGFDVKDDCAFLVSIDSEIVSRKDLGSVQLRNFELTLMKLENWLGYSNEERSIHIYDQFNDTKNLLFKDSTISLLSTKSKHLAVKNYIELFKHVDSCSGTMTIVAVLTLVLINFIVTRLI